MIPPLETAGKSLERNRGGVITTSSVLSLILFVLKLFVVVRILTPAERQSAVLQA